MADHPRAVTEAEVLSYMQESGFTVAGLVIEERHGEETLVLLGPDGGEGYIFMDDEPLRQALLKYLRLQGAQVRRMW